MGNSMSVISTSEGSKEIAISFAQLQSVESSEFNEVVEIDHHEI